MKKLFLLSSILLIVTISKAQGDSIPVPDFDNKPMYYNKATNTLEKLERQTAEMKVKNKFVVIESYYYFKNRVSDFRIKNGMPLQFAYKLSSNMEIEQFLTLYKYTVNESKNLRELKLSSASAVGSKTIDNKIQYDYKKISEGVYLISVDGLVPGEYGFATSSTTYLFGVDGN